MGDRITVLAVIKGLGRGGAEQLVLEQARRTDRSRFDLHVAYLLPRKQDLVEPLTEAGATVHGPLADGGAWPLALSRLVRRLDPDVIHTHSPVPATWLRLVARRPNIPVVSTEHNVWPRFRVPTRVANAATYGLSDHHFAVSDEVANSVASRWRDEVEVLHHGIDVEGLRARTRPREDVRAELGLSPEAVVSTTVANTRPKKDLPNLLHAAARATSADPALRFIHVGSGPEEAELHALHDQLGLGDRFLFLGKRSDAADIIAASDIFCLSSRHEGLPVTIMEAMAMGIPIVATAVGGIPEAVTDGAQGLLVPPGDPEGLAEALLRVATDADLRRMMAETSRSSAPRFDAGTSVARIESLYADLVASLGEMRPEGTDR